MEKKKILVMCTGNSCRSQMAEGYLRYFAGEKAEIYSAGTEVHGLNPLAVAFMLEDGIDISAHTSNAVEEYLHLPFDLIITVCDSANESCPVFPSTARKIHHNFPDPSKVRGSEEAINKAFRETRKAIREFCAEVVGSMFV